jgi:flagellar motor switch/type III secretory pathway protein FliN
MAVEVIAEQRLPKAEAEPQPDEERWRPVLRLPCELTVDLPLPDFKIANFLQLRVGSVVATSWQAGRDVPLRVNGALIGWSEFEVVGSRLAVRVT